MKFKFDRYICAGCNNLHTHTHAHKETHIQSRTKKVPCLEMCLLAYTTFTTPSLTSFYHFILLICDSFECVNVCNSGKFLPSLYEFCFVVSAHCNRAVAIDFVTAFFALYHCPHYITVVVVVVAVVVVNRANRGTCSTRLPSKMVICIFLNYD